MKMKKFDDSWKEELNDFLFEIDYGEDEYPKEYEGKKKGPYIAS